MPTRVYLIRHAETTATEEDRFAGSLDLPLSADGRAHASQLALRLSGFELRAVYTSPMRRAMETAQLIASPHSLDVIAMAELRELDHGHWEGMKRAEVEVRFPDEYAEYERDPLNFQARGGEPARAVVERAVPALRQIVRQHPAQEIAVISHKATNRLLIGYFLGIDLRGYRDKLAQRATCLNVLDFTKDEQVKLSLLNDISHYQICATPDVEYVV